MHTAAIEQNEAAELGLAQGRARGAFPKLGNQ